jgi:hypothetical protein
MSLSPEIEKTENIKKQLLVLSLLYYAVATMCLIGLATLPFMHTILNAVLTNQDLPQQGAGPAARNLQVLQTPLNFTLVIMGILFLLSAVLTVVTGISLFLKRHWTFCVVGSVLVCIWVPVGTGLGIWTLLLLFDQHTRSLFAQRLPLKDSDLLFWKSWNAADKPHAPETEESP